MRSLTRSCGPGTFIVLAALIVAVGYQLGHARQMAPTGKSHAASLQEVIGFPMYNALRNEVSDIVHKKLAPSVGNKIPDANAAHALADAVRDHLIDGFLKKYKLTSHGLPEWTHADSAEKIPPVPKGTLHDLLGEEVVGDLFKKHVHAGLLTRLTTYANNQTVITQTLIGQLGAASEEDTATGAVCWACIPDPLGQSRWYNSCTSRWGSASQ